MGEKRIRSEVLHNNMPDLALVHISPDNVRLSLYAKKLLLVVPLFGQYQSPRI